MVLTLKAYRRCTPERNRSIPTIPAGRADAGPANVSAVDTGPRRNESGVLAAQPGASVTGPPHHSLTAVCAESRWSWFDSGPSQSWPDLARVGLLYEGRDLLAKGCAYCTKAPPAPSTPNSRPVAPHLRAVHPDDAGSHHSDRVSLLRQAEAAALPSGRRTQAVS